MRRVVNVYASGTGIMSLVAMWLVATAMNAMAGAADPPIPGAYVIMNYIVAPGTLIFTVVVLLAFILRATVYRGDKRT